jgi:hypothetical protein
MALGVALLFWHYSRAERILQRWARDQGYQIRSKEHRWFRRGPFFWRTSGAQEVFYVEIRTPEGEIKRGWVCCGGWLLGMLQGDAEVRWDQ